MIKQSIIDTVKSDTDLVALVGSRGIELRKNGKNYKGLCPFHDDKTPSFTINPADNLWHCFGCGAGGDAIRFIEMIDKIEFPKAVEQLTNNKDRLSNNKEQLTPGKEPDSEPAPLPEEKLQQLYERTISVYEKDFEGDGRKYLENRHITDLNLMETHRVGFAAGRLKEMLPKTGPVIDELKQAGILLADGQERFAGCVVFPVCDPESRIITLYGRSIKSKRHVLLPGRSTGIWNAKALRFHPEIILTESVIDGLSVLSAGIENVCAVLGVNGLSRADMQMMQDYGVKKIIFLFDCDDPGRKAVKQLKEKIKGMDVSEISLPEGHDPNSFLQKHGPKRLVHLIQTQKAEPIPKPCEPLAGEPLGNGFRVQCENRNYRVMGLDRGPRKLRATIRIEIGARLHADTLDLWSARSRRTLASDLCRVFSLVPETAESDVIRIMKTCEQMPDLSREKENGPGIPVMTDKEIAEAEAFGKSPDLTDKILKDFQTCGLIGEQANKLLGYLAMTSRKQDAPLSMLILSGSGAGKTALQDAVIGFCPPEDLVRLTSLSGKALFYKEQGSLKNKVLSLEEGDGAQEAAYAIRSLISSGVLIVESTVKDLTTGRLTTMENRVEGPTSVFFTTTNPDTDPETASRFFVTGIDETRDQTRKILAFQRQMHRENTGTQKLKAEAVQKKHHNFQRLLRPLDVKNPFAGYLTYNDDRLQGRRDQPKYLNLIKAVAFLRQMQKKVNHEKQGRNPVPFIEADIKDITIANNLAAEILGKSLDELSRPGRSLLMLIDEMVEHKAGASAVPRTELTFTRRDIREFTGWADIRVHRYLKELVFLEYVLLVSGINGVKHQYSLAYEGQGKQGEKFMLGLKDPKELALEN